MTLPPYAEALFDDNGQIPPPSDPPAQTEQPPAPPWAIALLSGPAPDAPAQPLDGNDPA